MTPVKPIEVGAARARFLGGEHVDAGDAERDRQIADCGRAAGRCGSRSTSGGRAGGRRDRRGSPRSARHQRGDIVGPVHEARGRRRAPRRALRSGKSRELALELGHQRMAAPVARAAPRPRRSDRFWASRSASQAARAAPAIMRSSLCRDPRGDKKKGGDASRPRPSRSSDASERRMTMRDDDAEAERSTDLFLLHASRACRRWCPAPEWPRCRSSSSSSFPSDCRNPTKEERSGRLRFGQKPPAVCMPPFRSEQKIRSGTFLEARPGRRPYLSGHS